jgi:hypothetical protein
MKEEMEGFPEEEEEKEEEKKDSLLPWSYHRVQL